MISTKFKIAVIVTGTIFITACAGLNQRDISRIHEGMQKNEVVAVLGAPKFINPKSNSEEEFVWQLDSGGKFPSAYYVVFVDDKVVRFGKPTGVVPNVWTGQPGQ